MDKTGFLKLRRSMKLTQAQMAELLRVPLATIRNLERGKLDSSSGKELVRALITKDFSLAKATDRIQRARKPRRGRNE